jgi:hypothetical protein
MAPPCQQTHIHNSYYSTHLHKFGFSTMGRTTVTINTSATFNIACTTMMSYNTPAKLCAVINCVASERYVTACVQFSMITDFFYQNL